MLFPGDLDRREEARVAPGDLLQRLRRRPADEAAGQGRRQHLLRGDDRPQVLGHLLVAIRGSGGVGVPDDEDGAGAWGIAFDRRALPVPVEGPDPALQDRWFEPAVPGDVRDRLPGLLLLRLVVVRVAEGPDGGAPARVGLFDGQQILGEGRAAGTPEDVVLLADHLVDLLLGLGNELLRRLVLGEFVFRDQRPLQPAHAGGVAHRRGRAQDTGHRVVVGRGDGVELVVVATGAADRQGEKGAAHGVDLLVDDVDQHLVRVLFGEHLWSQHQKAGPGDLLEALGVGLCRHQVAGDLFVNEAVEGLVAVERVDDVVAIAEGVGESDVLVEAVRVGIAGDVEPVAAPTLTVVRRGEEPVDDPGERVGALVGEEILDLGFRRRQADQIERGAAEQGALVGRGDGCETLVLEARQDETVDGLPDPDLVLDLGRLGIFDPSIGPVLPAGAVVERLGRSRGDHRLPGAGARVGCASADPLLEIGDHVGRQLAVWRHLREALVVERLDHQAVLGRSRDDHRAAVASGAQPLGIEQNQSAADLRGIVAVAGIAALDQNRPDLRLEELEVGGVDLSGAGDRADRRQPSQDKVGGADH